MITTPRQEGAYLVLGVDSVAISVSASQSFDFLFQDLLSKFARRYTRAWSGEDIVILQIETVTDQSYWLTEIIFI